MIETGRDDAYMRRFNEMIEAWRARHGLTRSHCPGKSFPTTRKGKKVGRVSHARDQKCIATVRANTQLDRFLPLAPLVKRPYALLSREEYEPHYKGALLDPTKFDWRSLPTRPPLWTDATDPLRMVYTQHALDMGGPTIGFTLNLSDELLLRLQSKRHRVIDAFRKRIGYHLQAVLGRKVDFWFAMESPHGRMRWHLHGALAIADDEKPEAKRALLAASGIAVGIPARHYALRFSSFYDSSGWAVYACKRLAPSEELLGYSPLYASRPLSASARGIYEVHRQCAAVQRAKHKAFLKSRKRLHS
jgi:hypothetical protein